MYNDAIVKEVTRADSVIRIVLDFENAFVTFPSAEQEYLSVLNSSLTHLQSLQSIAGDDTLRLAAIQLVESYKSMIQDDFAQIYSTMIDSVYTAQDSVRVDSLMAEMYGKWQMHGSQVTSQQLDFAKRNGITLEKK